MVEPATHKFKQLTEDDVKFLTRFLKSYGLTKFDIVLNAVSNGESKILETLEVEYDIYFNEEDKKLLLEILKKHGYIMKEVTLTRIEDCIKYD